MKKLFSSFIILSLFLLLAWGVAGWLIGSNTESELKKYLTELENTPGEKLFRAELLDYKKTLLGAKARIKISSDTSFLNERLGDFELDAQFFNGPVFISIESDTLLLDHNNSDTPLFNRITFNTGTSRWKIVIDDSSVEEDKAEYVHSLFPNGLPIAIVRTGFDNKAYYQSHIDLKYAVASLSGIYNLDNGDNQGSLLFDRIEYGLPPRLITADRATLHYQHQRSITAAYKPGTTQLEIKGLEINHEVFKEVLKGQPLKLDLTVDTAIQSESDDVLNGLVEINLEKKDNNLMPITYSDIKIKFDNIPASGFIELSEQQAIHDNIRQQIQWVLEETGEFPEGQDHLWQLNDHLNAIQQQLPKKIAGLFLKSDNSQVRINATARSDIASQESKQSTLNAKISLNNRLNKDAEIDDLLIGEGQINLSNDLFNYLNPILNRMLKSKEKPIARDFEVVYREGELSVNN